MDEFLQEINAAIYMKWILLQNNDHDVEIIKDQDDDKIIIIKNTIVEGKIIFYGNGIFEEELTDRLTNKKIFYLHFQLTYMNHAIELFKEMLNCAKEATSRPMVQVLLCCSGGLTTTLFACQMQELADLESFPYKIEATGYSCLFERAGEYDIILLAPQVAYMLPQAKRRLPDKEVMVIPTKIFATNDFSGALKLVYDWNQSKEES
ncbi:PTS sugar transporter subunit IIB [uncultured Thomasclavelia sp.]|uniref:PTS sugar transporter subunit IIB n=1 Tax=uncultured Thomasclavelia sp. TaxID=3025759 RepID=UPI0025FB3631|nr:hypothetical protein [uncultured Thomasclavelia sp.]